MHRSLSSTAARPRTDEVTVVAPPASQQSSQGDGRFWLVAANLVLLLFSVGAPAPLYSVYQSQWQFSSITLTAVFAIYAIVLLLALLVVGSLSDYVGRRPVILAGLVASVVASVAFLIANGVTMLFLARALQGISVGVATGALGAALIDLQPEGGRLAPLISSAAPTLGLAAGALATSILVQYAPAPTQLIWWIVIAGFAAAITGVSRSLGPGKRQGGALASLRPRLGVPRQARGAFAFALPCLIAQWALGGLYFSLGPTLAAQLLGSSNLVWGGIVIFLLSGVGGIASLAFRAAHPSREMLGGSLAIVAGAILTLVSIATATSWLFLAGTAVTGVGFGPAFSGAYGTITEQASPGERGSLIAAVYSVCYVAFSVPALAAGVATAQFGLRPTALVYSAAIGVLAALTVVLLASRGGFETSPASEPDSQPPGPCTVPPTYATAARALSTQRKPIASTR